MNELVERLSRGEHPVEFGLRPQKTPQILKECLDRGYVHVKFTSTRGGTELGFAIDKEGTDLTEADFENEKGRVKVAGELVLDGVKVRCVADVDVRTMQGSGRLELL